MNKKKIDFAWLWLLIILIFLFIIGWVINSTYVQQKDSLLAAKSKIELSLLAQTIQDQLQKNDYDSAQVLIKNWGAGNTNILGITLSSQNGFELARYQSSHYSKYQRDETTTIPYSYNSLATLNLRRSLDQSLKDKQLFLYQLLTAYFLISIIFFLLTNTNIRIRKQKRDLKESQEQIRLLLNACAEGIYGLDKDNRCTFVNRAALKMLGYSEDSELIGKNVAEIIFNPLPKEPPHSHVNSKLESIPDNKNKSHFNGKKLWRKNNSSFIAEYWSHPIYKEREHVGAVVTFLDVTERNAATDALYRREQDLTITLDSIGDAVITTDEKGLVSRMNPVAEKLTGWSNEEAQGEKLQRIFPIINASTREPIESPVVKVLSHGETIYLSNHTTLISRDLKEYQIADSAAPILDKEKQIRGMVLVFHDVTEQYRLRNEIEKSHRTLQTIMDHSPSAIYIKDRSGRINYANHHAGALFHKTGEDLIGSSDHDLFPKEIADAIRSNDIKVMETRTALESEECALFGENIRYFSSIKFPIYDSNSNAVAICGISTDITERKYHEEKLHRSQKMESLGKLTGGIAHDFNNILGIILGFSELLYNALDDQPKLQHYLTQINHAGERGAKLTQRLLAFSKQETEHEKVLDINVLLAADQNMLEKSLTSRIILQYKLEEKLWPVLIEESSFEDAILNLCINAMHAMEEEGGSLIIETKNLQLGNIDALELQLPSGDYVLVSIKDTGCGMDEATVKRIFEPFFTTKEHKGTGLGLSQVYGFIERSKGAINVDSCLNEGTEFKLYFPRHQKEESPALKEQHEKESHLTA